MKLSKIICLLLSTFALVGCSFNAPPINPHDPFVKDDDIGEEEADDNIDIDIEDDVEIGEETSTNKITDLSIDGISYDESKKLFTITKGGEFVFKGVFQGNILVDAGDDDEVKLTLNGFTIKSNTDSPIKCVNGSELQISLKKDSVNYVYDMRETQTVDDDTQGNGAITSNCDMKVSGKGSLYMVGNYKNGFHTKDDLKIKPEVNNGSKIEIKTVNNCLKGNDSVEIESGNLVLISTAGNGIVTENSDVSSKGNQKGSVVITGGHIDIYAAKDAIDAAYNLEISKVEDGEDPVLNIYTSKYSEYSSDVAETSTSKMYLKSSSSDNANYYYAVEFMLDTYETTWSKATKISNSGGRSTYYELDRPSNATSLKVAYFAKSVTEMSEKNAYLIMSKYDSFNSYYDTASIRNDGSSISITGWSVYGSNGGPGGGPGGMSEG
ncbi:MAG: carbohydrate-binding domain-containing protein, partial [Bacilli bacterium]|nr:carbohydrate-binding domain-containing protein [Bacilli bacterium]